jgi:hypothetical protein
MDDVTISIIWTQYPVGFTDDECPLDDYEEVL